MKSRNTSFWFTFQLETAPFKVSNTFIQKFSDYASHRYHCLSNWTDIYDYQQLYEKCASGHIATTSSMTLLSSRTRRKRKSLTGTLLNQATSSIQLGWAELRHSSNVLSSFHFLASIFPSIHEGCSGFHVSEFAIASESSQRSLRCLLRTLVLLSSFIVHLTPAPRHRHHRTALVSSKHLTWRQYHASSRT